MFKRPFFCIKPPRLRYLPLESGKDEKIKELPPPRKVTLYVRHPQPDGNALILKKGNTVKTGQRLKLSETGDVHVTSSVTGTLTGFSTYTGYLGYTYLAVSIDDTLEDQWDNEFDEVKKFPQPKKAVSFLNALPGAPELGFPFETQRTLDTIVICGLDKDLLIDTNQLIVKAQTDLLREGMKHVASLFPECKLLMVVPPELTTQVQKTGAEVHPIEPIYPVTLPKMILKRILGRIVPAGKNCEDMGVVFMNAETVAALGTAFSDGHFPVSKAVTVIKKDYSSIHVRVRIGTPVREVLDALEIETSRGDRLILGGPMTGRAIHSLDMSVSQDTDALLIQAKGQIVESSNTHCVNCGECVRACPVHMPVNMLVRVLENGLYEEAANRYDLLSCIECGLCSYVCIARIPVFHYVMLGKCEFNRIKAAEEINA